MSAAKKPRPLRLTELDFDPPLERHSTTSAELSRNRDLHAWRRGERPDLRVLHKGRDVTPERIDWSLVPTGSGTSGTPGGERPGSRKTVRLSAEDQERLARIAKAHGITDDAEAIRMAIRETAARIDAQSSA